MKRPAAAMSSAAAKVVPKKGAPSPKVAKVVAPAKRPTMPKGKAAGPCTVLYRTGKITTSIPKQGYRVFRDCSVANPSDRLIPWHAHADKAAAWAAACKIIEDFDN